ncbi:MAG TPA: type IV pili methyl-accepting chemotaxis transducer N-terminal domain-containing protein [Burkholderiales bacterium]|nr:type IV pili methyl-accepting chemotaxis transducer N-terminal domain-containing protein [Burkholderiales bacterium]
MLRLVLAAAALALALPAAPAEAAAELSVASAINKAGRQRMLSQRIAKAYCQVALGVLPETSGKILEESIALFEGQLAELNAAAPTRQIRESVAALAKPWHLYRAAASASPAREACPRLSAQSDEVLAAAHRLTLELQDYSGTQLGRLVNVSGRQRMLSQRLAKLYMVRAAGPDSPTLRDEMESARNEFTGALAALQAAPENTPALHRELDSVALQWDWFQSALNQDSSLASYRLVVADSSESILRSMETVTRLYEDLGRGK